MDDLRPAQLTGQGRARPRSTLRRLAPLSEMYSVFSSGLSASPFGLSADVTKRDDKPLRIDQEHSLEIELARLVADVARVGDIDTSLRGRRRHRWDY